MTRGYLDIWLISFIGSISHEASKEEWNGEELLIIKIGIGTWDKGAKGEVSTYECERSRRV